MKPAPFDYVRAQTLDEIHAILAAEGSDAVVMAGGQTLMPLLSMRMARPVTVLDIMHVAALRGIEPSDHATTVRAGVRQAELLAWPELATAQPLLALMLPWVGHAQTRARGTVCGSAALADPSAEIPLAMVALRGTIVLSSKRGRREIGAEDFFNGLMSTDRADDEVVEAIRLPSAVRGAGHGFVEFARRHGDFAIVACAAIATADSVRLAVGGVADHATARDFPVLDGDAWDDALAAFAGDLDARDDLHASAEDRRTLVRHLGRQSIAEALRCRA